MLSQSSAVFRVPPKQTCQTVRQLTWKIGIVERSGKIYYMIPISANKRNVTLAFKHFRSSVILLQCTVYGTVRGRESFQQDNRFIEIINSNLTARIEGPEFAVHGGNNISLDGTKSGANGDPVILRDLVLKFAWFCTFIKISSLSIGCFGKSNSKPFSHKRVINMDVNKLAVGEYVFTLVVNSADVEAKAKHRMTVGTHTNISIR